MSSDRLNSFKYLMDVVGCSDYSKARDYAGSLSRKIVGQQIDLQILRNSMAQDAVDLHIRSITSFVEALIKMSQNSTSWPTVMMYYSVFYSAKCAIMSRGIFNFRLPMSYTVKATVGDSPRKLVGDGYNNDHESAIKTLSLEVQNYYILTNSVAGENPLMWLKKRREEVNYINSSFSEPTIQRHARQIIEMKDRHGWSYILNKVEDEAYIFDEDYAMILIPLRMIADNEMYMRENNISGNLDNDKIDYIKQMSQALNIGGDMSTILRKTLGG